VLALSLGVGLTICKYSYPIREFLGVPSPVSALADLDLAGRFVRGPPARRIRSMSIMAWKLLRWLPKPLLLVLFFFLLAAVARA
jgi:hypothetical protein